MAPTECQESDWFGSGKWEGIPTAKPNQSNGTKHALGLWTPPTNWLSPLPAWPVASLLLFCLSHARLTHNSNHLLNLSPPSPSPYPPILSFLYFLLSLRVSSALPAHRDAAERNTIHHPSNLSII